MQKSFEALAPEYAAYLSRMAVTASKTGQIDGAAKKILKAENIDCYSAAVEGTAIPPAFIGALELREDNCDPTRALGQGDPWNRVSTHVPRGKGPFQSRLDAMKFYIAFDHIDDRSHPWSMEFACYKGELWNGLGPRGHGRPTGYLWAGTSIYDRPNGPGGKYIGDGVWSPTTYDTQLGIVPVLLRIAQLRPDLSIGTALPHIDAPSVIPAPAPVTFGEGGGQLIDVNDPDSVKALQTALNASGVPGTAIEINGNYDRETMAAVRAYQAARGLNVDGLAGPVTLNSLGLVRA